MRAYVINLRRSADRRAYIQQQLERTSVQYQIVEAVDGRELDIHDEKLVDPATVMDGSFRLGAGGPGAAGCALSHLRVYLNVLESGDDVALVLEDDVALPPDLGELAEAIGQTMSGSEVVLLNFHSPAPCRVAPAESGPLPGGRSLVRPLDISQPKSTGAYLITRKACEKLADLVLPVRVTADDWEFFCRSGAIDNLFCVVPMPVVNSATFRSTIDFYKPGTMQARLRELLASDKLPVLPGILAYRRRRTFRKLGWTGDVAFEDERTSA